MNLNRRDFLAASAALGAGLALECRIEAATWKTTLRKAMIGVPDRQVLETWKAAGFQGMEVDWGSWQKLHAPNPADACKTAESLGMTLHSVLFGWGNMNGGQAAMADSIARMEAALRGARQFGADVVLYVPCRIDGMPMPEPWEFDVRFDEKTGHLMQVVAGENAKYQKYIDAHNHATDTTREGIRRLMPTAEKTGVVIALENVWNNLWVKPELHANLVASFQSPWVRAYFDIGNHVKYARPQDWIRTLGKLLAKCHVKDFRLNPDGHGGQFCNICDGSVDWPAVRKALDEIGYNGWLTIEGGDLSPQEHSKRLEGIITGQ